MNEKVNLLYEDESVKLYQGDCRDLELESGSIGTVITGFPYVEERANELELLKDMAHKLDRFLCAQGIFVNTNTDLRKAPTIRLRHLDILNAFVEANFVLYDYRIWDKEFGHDLYRIAFSHILAFHKDIHSRIKRNLLTDDILHGKAFMFGKYHDANSHAVTRKLIEIYSDEGDTIYDPFVGSGTLLLEARNLGRKAIGIELEVEIAQLALKRIKEDSNIRKLGGNNIYQG